MSLSKGTPVDYEVLIIGGGNAGVSLAARLHRYGVKDVAVVEPQDTHFYQPLFSHIAGGRANASEATRPQRSVMPEGVEWIRDSAVDIDPASNTVSLASGGQLGFGHLVVCPGLQLDWDKIPGLADAVHSPSGTSHYEFTLAAKSWTTAPWTQGRNRGFHHALRPHQVRRGRAETDVPGLQLLAGAGRPAGHPGGHGAALPHRVRGTRRG